MSGTTSSPEPAGEPGVWSDEDDDRADQVRDRPLIGLNELEVREKLKDSAASRAESSRAQQHTRKMQGHVLIGVGSLIVLTLAAVLIGLGAGIIDPEFAQQIMQTMLAPIVGAGLTIVGFFFRSGGSAS